MSSSDMAVETGLVLFVGVIQDTTAHETSPLHVSRQNQTVPWRQIASIHSCAGELANIVRVQHAVPLEKGDVVIAEMHSSALNGSRQNRGNNCDTPRSVSCDRLEEQWFGASNSVMRRRGSAGNLTLQGNATHTAIHAHDEEVCRLRKSIEHHRLGLDVLWPVCTRASLPLASFRKVVVRCPVQHLSPTAPYAAKAGLL